MSRPAGFTHSPETRERIAAALRGRRLAEENPNYRGGGRIVGAIHNMLARLPKRGQCVECGRCGRTDWACLLFAEGTGEHVYTRDPAGYGERCRRCHARLDRAMRRRFEGSPA